MSAFYHPAVTISLARLDLLAPAAGVVQLQAELWEVPGEGKVRGQSSALTESSSQRPTGETTPGTYRVPGSLTSHVTDGGTKAQKEL